jgi:tight adherence protein B
MNLAIDPLYVFSLCAALAVALGVEAAYLVLFNAQSYRSRVNRRLRVIKDEPDREQALIQLRRERGLAGDGRFVVHAVFNRLVLQSGLTFGLWRLMLILGLMMCLAFGAALYLTGEWSRAGVAAIVCGAVVPVLVLRKLRGRRWQKFGAQFPDAIDIIVRSLRAGHPVPVAIAMVAREMPDPVGSEFGMVADEVTYGADIETAMRALMFRVGQEDLPLFVTSVAIQGATGGNLSQILDNLSKVIRERFKMRRKIRALSSEGRFSALALSAMPVLLFAAVSYLTPNFYGEVWHLRITHIVLGSAAAWMMFGNYVMLKMVNFKI